VNDFPIPVFRLPVNFQLIPESRLRHILLYKYLDIGSSLLYLHERREDLVQDLLGPRNTVLVAFTCDILGNSNIEMMHTEILGATCLVRPPSFEIIGRFGSQNDL